MVAHSSVPLAPIVCTAIIIYIYSFLCICDFTKQVFKISKLPKAGQHTSRYKSPVNVCQNYNTDIKTDRLTKLTNKN